jgi:outer membrane protein OmpA-like peptidoglycan-associated protein
MVGRDPRQRASAEGEFPGSRWARFIARILQGISYVILVTVGRGFWCDPPLNVRAFERTTTMNRSTFTFLAGCFAGLVLSCSAHAELVSRNQIIDALTAPQTTPSKLGRSRSLTLDNNGSGYAVASEQAKPAVDLHDIYFEFDSAEISPDAMPQLRELGAALTDPRLANATFKIGGHTDATGGDAYNTRLSERRAEAVKRFLVDTYMIPSTNLHALGYGKHQPKNKADVYAAENRRVEIVNETPRAQAQR